LGRCVRALISAQPRYTCRREIKADQTTRKKLFSYMSLSTCEVQGTLAGCLAGQYLPQRLDSSREDIARRLLAPLCWWGVAVVHRQQLEAVDSARLCSRND
jgi:hypothetical protein